MDRSGSSGGGANGLAGRPGNDLVWAHSVGKRWQILLTCGNAQGFAAMAEAARHQARLIPTSGIAESDEQERRATSAALAVMSVVKQFSKSIVGPLGAPAGAVGTFA